MSARDAILAAVRRNQPQPAVPLPEIPVTSRKGVKTCLGYKEHFARLPEVPGTRRIEDVRDPHELNDVDVGVIRSPLGVAEAGAVWLTQTELVVIALGVLSQHLVVLLDPTAVVETLHDAYARLDLAGSPYGVFLAGPSATGDIEGVIIHGAQGARSLTILLLAPDGTKT